MAFTEKVSILIDIVTDKASAGLKNIKSAVSPSKDAVDDLKESLDKVGQAKPEAKVKADITDATTKIGEADKAGKTFDKTIFSAETDAKNEKALQAIREVGTKADALKTQVESEHPKLDVDTTRVTTAYDDVKTRGSGLTGTAVNSLSDLAGPLGDAGGQVSTFGQAFVGAAELAGPKLASIGLDVGKLAGVLGIGGAAVGAVIYFWNTFVGGADRAKSKLAEVQTAMAAGDFTAAAKGVTDALQPWRQIMDDVGVSVADATKFISGQTDVLPLNAAAVADATSKEHFLAGELQRQRQYWADNHKDLEQQQIDQFNATKAIGVTTQNLGTMTESLLGQARVAVPEVQKSILGYTAMINGVPESKFTEITTDANPDDVAQVEAILDEMAKDREAKLTVNADTATAGMKLQEIIDMMASIKDKTVHVNAVGGVNLKGTEASGGPINESGMYLVGEEGPEIVSLPSGSYVHPNSETMSMLGTGTSPESSQTAGSPSLTFVVNNPQGSAAEWAKTMVAEATWELRKAV